MRALITGSSRGLGAELAREFISRGKGQHTVFLHGRDESALRKLGDEMGCSHIAHDLTDLSQIDVLTDFARKHEIDVLINNAGIYQKPGHEISDIVHLINTNLTAGLILMRRFYDDRKAAGGGTLVSINSLAGLYPNVNEAFYCASKFGLTGFIQSLQERCSFDNIRVYEYFFGGMATDMTAHRPDHGLLIDPAEAARLIYDNLVNYNSLCVVSQKVKRLKVPLTIGPNSFA